MTRTYTVKTERNQLRGLEAATLVLVLDQHGTIWADTQISRDEFNSNPEYERAIADKVASARVAWPDEACDPTQVEG